MTVRVERSVLCHSSPEQIWCTFSDTSRLNRLAGLDRVQFELHESVSAARLMGHTKLGGWQVSYEELPFEWEYPKHLQIRRRMHSGVLNELCSTFLIHPEGEGTRVTMQLDITPRWRWMAPVLQLQAASTVQKLIDTVAAADNAMREGRSLELPPTPRMDALNRSAAMLKGNALGERLVKWVQETPDHDAARMRPFVLADQWQVDRRQLLLACMQAVTAGLLVLKWEVVCPGCRQSPEKLPNLSELGAEGRCHVCDMSYAVSFDETVEATFAPAPAIRTLDEGPWCSGGPARSPHVLVQKVVLPHQIASLPVPQQPGNYRVFVRGGAVYPLEVNANGAQRLEGQGCVIPGGTVCIPNPSNQELHMRLDRLDSNTDAATARIVTTMPGFRERFSTDVLRPGISLGMARLTFFFSDLADSTRLYAEVGDATAFQLVQDHFDMVIKLIEKHNGSIVKTIGDAVMAVFCEEEDGLRASIDILKDFETFVRSNDVRAKTHIKLGIYTGPCFTTNANKRLDYFGQTVNVAARLQGLARSGELVVEARLSAELQKLNAKVTAIEQAQLKGVSDAVAVVRARIA